MDIIQTLLSAAKIAHVSGTLLVAICSHESMDFQLNYVAHDMGSPSFGVCQLKEFSARQMGFKGVASDLNKPEINAHYAALYLSYQQKRYGEDWLLLVGAYNAGSYLPNEDGCPKNMKYIRLVQEKLPEDLKPRLDCDVIPENE